MARLFQSAAKQAAHAMKKLQGTHIKSVGTVRNYEQCLTRVCEYIKEYRLGDLESLTEDMAVNYLEYRSEEVGQKTLDMERQAMQSYLRDGLSRIDAGHTLKIVKSEHTQILHSRAYSTEQINMVANAQTPFHSLSTQIAHEAGLRAHELYTIRPIAERGPDPRESDDQKFHGLNNNNAYTVTGKGGLSREIRLSDNLSRQLEDTRLNEPRDIIDRGIHHKQYYNIGGGHNWSSSYSSASNRALGWSKGAHGLRHSFAQERMSEVAKSYDNETALRTVSQEMGHFRPDITKVYLR